MPDLIKVGFSRKDPELRALELNNTGNPYPYKVEYDILVFDPIEVEKKAHNLLNSYHENKEWFKCSIQVGIKAIQESAKEKMVFDNSQSNLVSPPVVINSRFALYDGVAVDKDTGLTWLRFSYGQDWKCARIQGIRKSVMWQKTFDIIKEFNESGGYAGNNDWRLPNIDELNTLILKEKGHDGYFIDTNIFPENNPTNVIADNTFWSSTCGSYPRNFALGGDYVYVIDFLTGMKMASRYKYQRPKYFFRLVRGNMLNAKDINGIL